jgi:hypothetical protein
MYYLRFLNSLVNLATVLTLVLRISVLVSPSALLESCSNYYKSMVSNSLDEAGEKAELLPTMAKSISVTFSARKGRDHVKRSMSPGKWNGWSTSLYYLMFILSFSINITAPLLL